MVFDRFPLLRVLVFECWFYLVLKYSLSIPSSLAIFALLSVIMFRSLQHGITDVFAIFLTPLLFFYTIENGENAILPGVYLILLLGYFYQKVTYNETKQLQIFDAIEKFEQQKEFQEEVAFIPLKKQSIRPVMESVTTTVPEVLDLRGALFPAKVSTFESDMPEEEVDNGESILSFRFALISLISGIGFGILVSSPFLPTRYDYLSYYSPADVPLAEERSSYLEMSMQTNSIDTKEGEFALSDPAVVFFPAIFSQDFDEYKEFVQMNFSPFSSLFDI